MSYPASNEQDYPRVTPAVQALIAINVAILFLQMTIVPPETMQGALGFNFATAPARWWSVVTYMFAHHDFWHLFWNMYALFIFGPRLEHLWGTKKFVFFYSLSGNLFLVGILQLLSQQFLINHAVQSGFSVLRCKAIERTMIDECLVSDSLIPVALQNRVAIDRGHNALHYLAGKDWCSH